MTEERKQELAELLDEAAKEENLQIRYEHGRGWIYGYEVSFPVDEYRKYLQERWASYSVEPAWFSFYVKPYIVSETTKSKLLDFIREELALCIEEHSVYSVSYGIEGSHADGFRLEVFRGGVLQLDACLNHLLKIAIVCGVEEAVSVFERFSCTGGSHAYFQHIASLKGIRLESEIHVFEGVRLVTVPGSSGSPPSGLMRHMPSIFDMREDSLAGKTLLHIDRPVFSICHKRSQEMFDDGPRTDNLPYQFDLDGEKFTDSEAVKSFENLFCQALSLACNSAVQISGRVWFLAEEKFVHPHNGGVRLGHSPGSHRNSIEAGEAEINGAKCLYEILKKNTDITEKLRIPIERWIKSKADGQPVDKMIDLGIAFEALYLSDVNEELTFRLGVRAAWFLGKDGEHRKALLKRFVDIYRCRSNAVHSGRLDESVRFGDERIPINEFIERVQDLCRDSIMKVLNTEQFPNRNYWDGLIVSGEDQQASSA